jgi:hypothetical protein
VITTVDASAGQAYRVYHASDRHGVTQHTLSVRARAAQDGQFHGRPRRSTSPTVPPPPFVNDMWLLLGHDCHLPPRFGASNRSMTTVDPTTDCADHLSRAAVHVLQAIQLVGQAAPGVLQDLGLEIIAALPQGPAPQNPPAAPSGSRPGQLPIADRATFCARWANRSCHLGETKAFLLLERLARRPNHLVHRDVLLADVWDEHTSPEALRSTVKILRRKLRDAGMAPRNERPDHDIVVSRGSG